jgi:2-phosphoglycerate kinase
MINRDLKEAISPIIAAEYLAWVTRFQECRAFCIILMGVAGVGKSEIASELIERLYDPVTIPLDLVRGIVRSYLSERSHPVVWASSYNASEREPYLTLDRPAVVEAYREQNRIIEPAIEAMTAWGNWLGKIVILEGVNVEPATVVTLAGSSKHRIFAFLIAEHDESRHWSFLEQRDRAHPRPPVSLVQYKKYFHNIREIQGYLMSEATNSKLPILNPSKLGIGKSVRFILDTISSAADPPGGGGETE